MIEALKSAGIYDSTLFIVSAKHGQSPINPAKVNKPGHFADLVAALPDAGTNPAALAIASANACTTGPCGFVQDDDVALIWLQDQSQTQAVTDYLNTNAKALFIDEVLAGDELKLKFNDPANDSRTPDIIVQPNYGTIYTGSTAKNAEHGGLSFGDTNVALIVSNPRFRERRAEDPGRHLASRADDPARARHRSRGAEIGAHRTHAGAARHVGQSLNCDNRKTRFRKGPACSGPFCLDETSRKAEWRRHLKNCGVLRRPP